MPQSVVPFTITRQIMDYAPRLPHLDVQVWHTIHTHYISDRLCSRCGEFLERVHARFQCCCRHRVFRCRWNASNNRKFPRVYRRPFHIFTQPSVNWDDFHEFQSHHEPSYYILSNQSELIFSFLNFLRAPSRYTIEKRLNTNTCFRTIQDSFPNISSSPSLVTTTTQGFGNCPSGFVVNKLNYTICAQLIETLYYWELSSLFCSPQALAETVLFGRWRQHKTHTMLK